MEKIVESGERITTIVLDGTECAVKFASKYRVFCVKSDSDVTVSLASGKSAGDDGVMVCKAGESIMYPHMRQLDTVYITGSGNVTVYAGNEAVNPFKGGQKGGVKKSDFDALSQNVDDISDDVDLLESRFDNTVSAITTDTEVTDIRVGADGTTYQTAGEAVRGQVGELKQDIDSVVYRRITNKYNLVSLNHIFEKVLKIQVNHLYLTPRNLR